MDARKEGKLKKKSRNISVIEGSAYSISDGFGFRYITPFALALKANNFFIGLLSSIPTLVGNLAQFISLREMRFFSRKKIVFCGAFLQAIMWLALILVGIGYFSFGLSSRISLLLLFIFYCLLVSFGAITVPPWNSWMKDIVSSKEIGRYFARRNMVNGIVAIVSMLIAGVILHYFENVSLLLGFTLLFGIAFVGRSISSFLFFKEYEPEFKFEERAYFSLFDFLKRMPQSNFGKFTLYLALVNLVVAIASPFFSVYMLKDLGFNYFYFTIIILISPLASLLFMPFWGKIEDTYGSVEIMRVNGLLIVIVPLLWAIHSLVSINVFYYLILVEIFSGFAWAGFNLASANFIFDAVSRQKTAFCVAYTRIIVGVFYFVGAIAGGFLSSKSITFFGLNPIIFLFLLSGVGRFLVYFLMTSKFNEVKKVKQLNLNGYVVDFFRTLEQKISRPRGELNV